jgi:tetratricopeptide (TPR) repeat protein
MNSRRRRAPSDPPTWRGAAAVFLLALAIRLIHLWQIRRAPFFPLLMGDAASYDTWARQIAAGDWLGHDVFYQAPLYPYALGVVYSVLGHHLVVVRVLQVIVGAGACALMTAATGRLFGRRAGIAAGILLAVYAPAIFFDALIQKSVLDLVFLCGLLLAVAPGMGSDRGQTTTRGRAALAGIAAGCLALTRENTLVLVPVLLVWIWLRDRRAAPIVAFALGLAVVLAPVAIRNRAVGGEWTLTTSQAGPNLYIGNSPNATGMYVPLKSGHGTAAYERQDAIDLADAATGRTLTSGEVSRYWRERALGWMWSHPTASLRLLARKILLVWNTREVSDTEDLDTYADWSWPLRGSAIIFNFGVIAPLAMLGAWLTRARWRELWVFYAMAAVYAASVAVFYVLARYRYPLVALLMPFAGAALAALPAWWRGNRASEKWWAAGVLGVAVVVCHWPVLSAASTRSMRAGTHYNIGYDLQIAGRNDEAITEYRAALALWPDLADAHSNLGLLLAARGEHDEALQQLRDALRLDPAMSEAHVNLGLELAARHQAADAIASFERALELDPTNATAHYNLGTVLAGQGRFDPAIEHLQRALALRPDFPEARQNLAQVRAAARGGR